MSSDLFTLEDQTFNSTAYSAHNEACEPWELDPPEIEMQRIPGRIDVLVGVSPLSTLDNHQCVVTHSGMIDPLTVRSVALARFLGLAQLSALAEDWEFRNQFTSRVANALSDREADELASHGADSIDLALERLDSEAAPLWLAFLERLAENPALDNAESMDEAINAWKSWGRDRQRAKW